jgi:ribonuclease I
MQVGHIKAILKVHGYRLKEVDIGLHLSIIVQACDKGTAKPPPSKTELCQQDVDKSMH